MRKTVKEALFIGAAAALALTPVSVAFAEEVVCRGTIGQRIVDNVRVPPGRTCTLNGTNVQGTVKVERNASLKALGVRVVGNIQAEGAADVTVRRASRVGGSIQIVQGESATIVSTRLNGDLLFDSNDGPLTASDNTIGGNLQAFQNTGGLSITENVIDGNLQCKENRPRPTGFGNVVEGNKEDQCENL